MTTIEVVNEEQLHHAEHYCLAKAFSDRVQFDNQEEPELKDRQDQFWFLLCDGENGGLFAKPSCKAAESTQ